MGFLIDRVDLHGKSTPEQINAAWPAYQQYLESVKDSMPAGAFGFATAPWHYDHGDHRCPHDAWVEFLAIREPASGERQEKRAIEIHVRLLGAYHDGFLDLTYRKVSSYSLHAPAKFKLPPLNVGHGDWIIDEIRLSETGRVIHEIEFSRGSRWLIECSEIEHTWTPK